MRKPHNNQPPSQRPRAESAAAMVAAAGVTAAAVQHLASLVSLPITDNKWGGRADQVPQHIIKMGNLISLAQLGGVMWSIHAIKRRLLEAQEIGRGWCLLGTGIAALFGVSAATHLAACSTHERVAGTLIAVSIGGSAAYLSFRSWSTVRLRYFPRTYQFTLSDYYPPTMINAHFDGCRATYRGSSTILQFNVIDQAHLGGVLANIVNRDLPLVGIKQCRHIPPLTWLTSAKQRDEKHNNSPLGKETKRNA